MSNYLVRYPRLAVTLGYPPTFPSLQSRHPCEVPLWPTWSLPSPAPFLAQLRLEHPVNCRLGVPPAPLVPKPVVLLVRGPRHLCLICHCPSSCSRRSRLAELVPSALTPQQHLLIAARNPWPGRIPPFRSRPFQLVPYLSIRSRYHPRREQNRMFPGLRIKLRLVSRWPGEWWFATSRLELHGEDLLDDRGKVAE